MTPSQVILRKYLRDIIINKYKKATRPDNIPSKLVKISANVIDSALCNKINEDLQISSFSDAAKIGSVRSIYKKSVQILWKIICQF